MFNHRAVFQASVGEHFIATVVPDDPRFRTGEIGIQCGDLTGKRLLTGPEARALAALLSAAADAYDYEVRSRSEDR